MALKTGMKNDKFVPTIGLIIPHGKRFHSDTVDIEKLIVKLPGFADTVYRVGYFGVFYYPGRCTCDKHGFIFMRINHYLDSEIGQLRGVNRATII